MSLCVCVYERSLTGLRVRHPCVFTSCSTPEPEPRTPLSDSAPLLRTPGAPTHPTHNTTIYGMCANNGYIRTWRVSVDTSYTADAKRNAGDAFVGLVVAAHRGWRVHRTTRESREVVFGWRCAHFACACRNVVTVGVRLCRNCAAATGCLCLALRHFHSAIRRQMKCIPHASASTECKLELGAKSGCVLIQFAHFRRTRTHSHTNTHTIATNTNKKFCAIRRSIMRSSAGHRASSQRKMCAT